MKPDLSRKRPARLRLQQLIRPLAPYQLLGRLIAPTVLIGSVPKSGTHLLMHCLTLFPWLRLSRATSWAVSGRGEVSQTHEPYEQFAAAPAPAVPYRLLFIQRDPRAIAASFYRWASQPAPGNGFYPYFRALPDDAARLTAVIAGMSATIAPFAGATHLHDHWAGIVPELAAMESWHHAPDLLILRFEDLVGGRGGGDDARQADCIRRIASHLALPLTDRRVNQIQQQLFGHTRTFVHGQIDSWRQLFQPQHVALFKELAGELLIRQGYETDRDW